jgi:hypothetical protein
MAEQREPKRIEIDFDREDKAIKCTCGGFAERVPSSPETLALFNCGRQYECCARTFVCAVCGTPWIGMAPAPELNSD